MLNHLASPTLGNFPSLQTFSFTVEFLNGTRLILKVRLPLYFLYILISAPSVNQSHTPKRTQNKAKKKNKKDINRTPAGERVCTCRFLHPCV